MGAIFVSLGQHAALQYVILTQNKESSPETQARFHAKCANDYKPLTPAGESQLLFCLHLSLFLFTAGLLIYFFNINCATFYAVVSFIAIITVLYTFLSVSPIYDRDMLIVTLFSPMVLQVYLSVLYVMVQASSWIKPLHGLSTRTKKHYRDLSYHFRGGITKGNAELHKEAALKSLSEINAEVLEHILLDLDEDHACETFFNTVPGFCGSTLVQLLYWQVRTKLQQSLDGFLDCTFSSRLVPESIRNNQLIICLKAAHSALRSIGTSQILGNFFHGHRDNALKSIELGHSLICWSHGIDDSIDLIV